MKRFSSRASSASRPAGLSRPLLLVAAAIVVGIAATVILLSPKVVLSQESRRDRDQERRDERGDDRGGDRALNIGPNRTGLSIGDSREWTGVRLNFRDTRLRRVTGINATVWNPKEGGEGDITGIALGLPLTGG
ncbi:MAG TPA: hypothetical protein VFV33_06855, partial [Gemmatimonadaceae bacterium]|nr:hypothetical protein [Gemmatimonadaceae bacterium]